MSWEGRTMSNGLGDSGNVLRETYWKNKTRRYHRPLVLPEISKA